MLLLEIVPRDVDADARPVRRRIFVVCVRSSTIMLSSGDADRANGQTNDWKIKEEISVTIQLVNNKYFQTVSKAYTIHVSARLFAFKMHSALHAIQKSWFAAYRNGVFSIRYYTWRYE